MPDFAHSHAVVVGIDDYHNGISPLRTAGNDARRLAKTLTEHGYTVNCLFDADATRAGLETFFTSTLLDQVGPDDRVLVYFAGHGIALDGDDGPAGYLVPQDARLEERATFLSMTDLNAWLTKLPCRHLLLILDCCFAGAFRWASNRNLTPAPDVVHQERYERFLRDPAWQVITSAAYDQRALDQLAGDAKRGIARNGDREHSPFAQALFAGLAGEGDLVPKGQGDGVITTTELYLYLRDAVEIQTEELAGHKQTPGLWPLKKHDKGEYVFLVPGRELSLPPAPKLTAANNPWRGLESYDEKHGQLFFGRDDEIAELARLVARQPITAVLGASGTGKSSLVKAGLLPYLRRLEGEANSDWLILPPLRPTATPLQALHSLLAEYLISTPVTDLHGNADLLANLMAAWQADNQGRKLLLVVDQMEELVTLCRDDAERQQFLALLARAAEQHPETFCLVITLRTDFEPQLAQGTPLAESWARPGARYIVPPMDHDDLRQVIEGPASARVLYFEPYKLVDELIGEVIQTPGALPLLSFTLSELYVKYLGRQEQARRAGETAERSLTETDYRALGGVIGSLRSRATEEHDALPDDAHRETMRRVMLRLVAVEGGDLARRRAARSELIYLDDAENGRVDEVIRQLVAARLVVEGREAGGEAYVEPAHDALVRAWDKLLVWKAEAEEYLPLQRRLAQAAAEWESADEKNRTGLLWDGDPRLPQVEDLVWPAANGRERLAGRLKWLKHVILPDVKHPRETAWLNRREVRFAQGSVNRRAGILRRFIGISLSVFVILLGLTILALYLRGQAVEQAGISRVGQLAAESEAIMSELPQVSLLLAAEAVTKNLEENTPRVLSAEQSLLDTLSSVGGLPLHGHRAVVTTVAFSTDGRWLATGSWDGTVRLWELLGSRSQVNRDAKIETSHELVVSDGRTTGVHFSPDGRWLIANSDRQAKLWRLNGNKPEEESADLSGFGGYPEALAFSPDSCRLAVGNEDGSVRLLNLCSSNNTRSTVRLIGHVGEILALAFSPDGRWLVTGSGDQTATLWALDQDGDLPKFTVLPGHGSSVRTVVFSPDSRWLVTAGVDDKVAWLWGLQHLDLAFGHQPTATLRIDATIKQERQVAFSNSGQWLAVPSDRSGTADATMLWNLSLDRPDLGAQLLIGHRDAVHTAIFTPDDRWLATGSWDGTVRLWPFHDTGLISNPIVLTTPDGGLVELLATPDSHWLIAVGDRRNVAHLWELQPAVAAEPLLLQVHDDSIASAATSHDGRWLVTGSFDGSARLWSLHEANLDSAMPVILPRQGFILDYQVTFSSDSHWVFSQRDSNGGQSVIGWNLDSGEKAVDPDLICDMVIPYSIDIFALSQDHSLLVIWGSEGLVYFFSLDLEHGVCKHHDLPWLTETMAYQAVATSPDGRWLVVNADLDSSGTMDPGAIPIALWDLVSPIQHLVAACRDGAGVDKASSDHWFFIEDKIIGWVLDEEGQVGCKVKSVEHVTYTVTTRDGRWAAVLTGDPGPLVEVWDMEGNTPQIIHRLDISEYWTMMGNPEVAISQDARWLVLVPWGSSSAVLWDLSLPKPQQYTLGEHNKLVGAVAFSPDGRWLATFAEEYAIRLWDLHQKDPSVDPLLLRTGMPSRTLEQELVFALTFSPDSRWLAASKEDEIQLWPLGTEEWLQRACLTAGRNFSQREWDTFFPAEPYRCTCSDLPPGEHVPQDVCRGNRQSS